MNEQDFVVDNIIKVLRVSPAKLHIYDRLVIPYSLHENPDQYADMEIEYNDDKSKIKLFNMLTDQYDDVPLDSLGRMSYYTVQGEPVIGEMFDDINLQKQEIQSCVDDPNILHDQAAIIAIVCEAEVSPIVWSTLKKFNLQYSIEQLREPDQHIMEQVKDSYMDLIREHRDKCFTELDQLEDEARAEGADEEDLKDIDTIKQMFRDIPQDTDLSQYKTINELYEFWPSLLLPKPKNLLTRAELDTLEPENTPDYLTELRSLLSHIDNTTEIKLLLTEIGDLKKLPSGAYDLFQERVSFIEMTDSIKNA